MEKGKQQQYVKKGVSPVKHDKPVKPTFKGHNMLKVFKISEDKDSNKEQIVSKEEIPLEAKVSEESTKLAIHKKDVLAVMLDKQDNEDKCDKNVDEEKSQSQTKDVKAQHDSSDSTNKDAEGKTDSGTKVAHNKKAMRLMAQLIKFYKFYYLLYLNKRWLNSQ